MQQIKIQIRIVARGWFFQSNVYVREVLLPQGKLPCGVTLTQHQSGCVVVSVHLYRTDQSELRPLPVDTTLDAPFAQVKMRNVRSVSVAPSEE